MKHYGKLTAAAAAGFMALSAMGVVPVFAVENTTVVTPTDGTYTITKNLTLTDSLKPADDVTFTYAFSNGTGTAGAYVATKEPSAEFNGVNADRVFTLNNTSANAEKDTYTTTFTINPTNLPGAGIFVYELTEKESAKTGAYEGFTDEVETYTIKVGVVLDKDGNKVVNSVVAVKNGTKVNNLSFAATYDPSDLTVTKVVSGNQAVVGTEFPFKVVIKGQKGEEYKLYNNNEEVTGATISEDGTYTWTNVQVTSVAQSDNPTAQLTIKGLTASDTYTITETNSKGYTASNTVNTGEYADGKTTSTKELGDTTDVTFTNTKNGTIPTGILMTAAPYAGLVGLGGIFAGLFFRRKRED